MNQPVIEVVQDRLLTPEEFCIRLGLARETVRRLTRRGLIRVVRLSRNTLRYRESEIERFISTRKK
jgi:excisionase family DNA binding protein